MIRKESYTYYANLQKNVEHASGIFSIIPSEVPGNLYCHTSPRLPVIGYMEVSTTVEKKRYVTAEEVYIPDINNDHCYFPPPPNIPPPECSPHYFWKWTPGKVVLNIICIDCIAAGGTKNKPTWWPTDHL
jgi:hypothetical protein